MDVRRAFGQLLLLLVMAVEAATRTGSRPVSQYGQRQDIPSTLGKVQYNYLFTRGTYDFGYDTGDGEHQSFRQESRSETGAITGLYGYIEKDGSLRVVQYEADERGFRSSTAKYRPVSRLPLRPPRKPQTKEPGGPPLLIVGPIPVPLPQLRR